MFLWRGACGGEEGELREGRGAKRDRRALVGRKVTCRPGATPAAKLTSPARLRWLASVRSPTHRLSLYL